MDYLKIFYVVFFSTLTSLTLLTDYVVNAQDNSNEFGNLKLCPPGGPSFVYAWNLACEMKRKKRSAPDLSEIVGQNQNVEKRVPEGYRPATIKEIMKICCDVGCEIRDLLSYCDPFGSWNS